MATLFTLLVILAVFTFFAALADHEESIKRGMKLLARALRLT